VQWRRGALAARPIPGEQAGRPWWLEEVDRGQVRLGWITGAQFFGRGAAPRRRVVKCAGSCVRVSRQQKVNTIDDGIRVSQPER
jgi:hypothetical protein